MQAPTGVSLHIGLNSVDPTHYQGWDGTLAACEFDANDMRSIAESRGFRSTVVLTKEATSDRVIEEIGLAAASLRPGDIFLLTYSGHGGQVPDTNGDEGDDRDETWVLYDRQVVDDELFGLWSRFARGVRVLVLSDSCHSGSVTRALFYESSPADAGTPPRFKMIPRDVQERTYQANQGLYDGIQAANPQGDHAGIGATVLLISGCQDNQFSRDGDRNGLFTQTLREVWAEGTFAGHYRAFHRAITDRMPPDQTPNYFVTGLPNPLFESQTPFSA
jgi:hypothetical protein